MSSTSRYNGKVWLGPVVGAIVAALLGGVAGWLVHHFSPTSTNSANATVRQSYADLYNVAWRQDDGQGNTLVTATLMLPRMITLLGQDSGRSSAEDQLYTGSSSLTTKQAGIFLTFDSVSGGLPDSQIQSSATLTVDGQTWTTVSWNPYIGPSHVVNTDQPTSFQSGLMVFQNTSSIDWTKFKTMTLTVKNIDGTPDRKFTWVDPNLLQSTD